MKTKKLNNGNFAIRLDRGDKIRESLQEFCRKNKVMLGHFNGIGAISRIELMHYSLKDKKYSSKVMEEPLEIVSLSGNITSMNFHPRIHSHIVVSDAKMRAFAGHLNEATVSATCEIFLTALKGVVERKRSDEIGLDLMDVI